MSARLALIALAFVAAAAAEDVAPSSAAIGMHGTFAGQRFWARLLPPDLRFGGHRVLQLVYTPPAPEALGGGDLSDCPFVLLDEQERVVAWNGRDTLSQAQPTADGYRVTRELQGPNGEPKSDDRTIAGGRAWDLGLAPIELALRWRVGAAGSEAVVDLFGPRAAERLSASWSGTRAEIAGAAYDIAADERGRLIGLAPVAPPGAAAAEPLLRIDAWTIGESP